MAEKPQAVTLAQHGVVGPDDTRTPAFGVATPPYVQRKVDEVKQETLAAAVKAKVASWIGAGVLSGVTLAGVAFAFGELEDKAKDAGTAAAITEVAKLKADVTGQGARLSVLEQQQKQTRDDVHEVQTDIRSLYKAVMSGERQERLERPPTPKDGGP